MPKQMLHAPDASGKPGGHRRSAPQRSWGPQTPMHAAEVVDTAQKIQARLQSLSRAHQVPGAPGQYRGAFAECSVQRLDVTGRDHMRADLTPQPHEDLPASLGQMHQPLLLYLLHENKLREDQQTRVPRPSGSKGGAESPPEGFSVATQAVANDQKRPGKRGPAHHLGQLSGRLLGALGRDEPAQSQAGTGAERREEVEPPAMPVGLGADKDLVGLHVMEHLWLEHERFMDVPAVRSSFLDPAPDSAALKAEGRLDGGYWATVGDERQHERDGLRRSMGVEKGRASACGEGLAALGAAVAFSRAAVDLDVAAPGMTASRTVLIRTEGSERVHVVGASSGWQAL